MRILVVAPYYPPHRGGVEGFADELDQRLSGTPGVESVTVLTTRLPGDVPAESMRGSVRLLRMPALEPVYNFPLPALWSSEARRLVRAACATRPDVVVTHTRFFPTSALGGWLARRMRCGWVHVEHGSDFVQSGGLVGAAARVWDGTLGRLILRRAHAVVAISAATARFVERISGREARVIYRGFEVADGLPARPLPGNAPEVLYVGRLIEGKGVHHLLEALAAVADLEWHCQLAGAGDRRAALEAHAARLGLGDRTRFLGEVDHHGVLRLLGEADVFVNPSLSEGLPTTVLEAAAAHVAIVATDVGGTQEVVRDGQEAVLVPAADPAALAGGLRRVLTSPELRGELGTKAAAGVRERFSWTTTISQWLGVLEEAARIGRSGATPRGHTGEGSR